MSELWRAYENLLSLLRENNYVHHRVNHKENFVNPENLNFHRQNVEGFWPAMKRNLRNNGGTNYFSTIEHHNQNFDAPKMDHD